MPLRLLMPKIDELYKIICLHCHFGELWEQQVLLGIQTMVAVLFTVGYQTRVMAVVSWYMYTSLILRNTWLYFILDRYFYYLLFYAMFLPLDEKWSVAERIRGKPSKSHPLVVSPATVSYPQYSYKKDWISILPSKCQLNLPTCNQQNIDWLETSCTLDLLGRWWG